MHQPGAGADRLAQLEAAIGWWNGSALDEFRHEPRAEAEAVRLDELRVVADEDRTDLLIAFGRSAEAISALGSRALRAYQDYRTLLADEAGTEPSASVQTIEQRVAAPGVDERHDLIERLRTIGRREAGGRGAPPPS